MLAAGDALPPPTKRCRAQASMSSRPKGSSRYALPAESPTEKTNRKSSVKTSR